MAALASETKIVTIFISGHGIEDPEKKIDTQDPTPVRILYSQRCGGISNFVENVPKQMETFYQEFKRNRDKSTFEILHSVANELREASCKSNPVFSEYSAKMSKKGSLKAANEIPDKLKLIFFNSTKNCLSVK